MLVLFAYGVGYAFAVIRSGIRNSVWLNAMKAHNTAVALIIVLSLSAINLGLPSFFSIAVNSQMQQLTSGRTAWGEFDFAYLRFESGLNGYSALTQALDDSSFEINSEQRQGLERLLEKKERWSAPNANKPPSEPVRLEAPKDCPPFSSEALVGSWHGSNEDQTWIVTRHANGHYSIAFDLHDNFPNGEHVESGLWTYSNCLYATVTTHVNDTQVHYEEVYLVNELTKEYMDYTHFKGGNHYRVFRITE
jgi:hypothetical protein